MNSYDSDRFQSEAGKYAAYLETRDGRLRSDLAFANLQEFLPKGAQALRALDIGGGTGALAVRLARLGSDVTVLDESPPMLDIARSAAEEAGVSERITFQRGDASGLANLVPAKSFDLIVCHNVLEFIHDPGAVLRDVNRVTRDSLSMISVLVRNRAGEVMKGALVNGDLAASERNLTADWGEESLYGGKVRLFTEETVKSMLLDSSFMVRAERGVRIISDYLPPKISRVDNYDQIFELERKLGRRPEFAAVARYTQWIAQPMSTTLKADR